ncbi:phosphatase PAP2 family protein [Psychrobacter proteolyticus]
MIVPYSWSLVLFVVSFFLVRTSTQLSLLTYRLILATVFACLIFYFYPARFSFHRLITDDWTQFGYQFLQLVDKPFNQLPSLHVSYAILLGVSLWDVAESKKRWGSMLYRLLLLGICSSIALSTVLTYQHHLLDMFGGIVLAVSVLILSN